jgi:hypothetical protein
MTQSSPKDCREFFHSEIDRMHEVQQSRTEEESND